MNNTNKYMTSPGRMSLPPSDDYSHDDDLSIDDFDSIPPSNVVIPPIPTDSKTLERLIERSYVKDWQRLNLCNLNSASSPNRLGTDQFRLTTVNSVYMMCRSYPALLVMPAAVPDESIRRFCRCYRQGRIPCITWRHPKTKALLLRGAGHHGKSVMGMLKSHPTPATSTETTSSFEQEKYLSALVSATPVFAAKHSSAWGMSDSSLSIDSLLLAAEDPLVGGTLTPEVVRRSNPFNKAMGTLGVFPRSSGGKGPKNFGRWGSLKDRRQSSQASLANVVQNRNNIRHSVDVETNTDGVHTLQRAALYILGEKAQMKGVKVESAPKTDFIPVEYYDVRHTKAAFKKLMRACIPSSTTIEPEQSFYKLAENSEWLQQLQSIMQLSGAVVDLLDLQGSSVAICLEDGWDVTSQVSSVAQLCLDPHYRTIEGFRVLVEKEWIGFGHRFSHRSNFNANSQASGFAPTFLQFLDVIHQVRCSGVKITMYNNYNFCQIV